MSKKVCLEYIWIDRHNEVRSKIKIMTYDDLIQTNTNTLASTFVNMSAYASASGSSMLWDPLHPSSYTSTVNRDNIYLHNIPIWNFDGSSTGQASSKISDVVLRPCRIYKNPLFTDTPYLNHYLILCECYDAGFSVHETNHRAMCRETSVKFASWGCLFGIEQEYALFERRPSSRLRQPTVISKCDCDEGMCEGLCWKKQRLIQTDYDFVCQPYQWLDHDEPGKQGQGPYYCSAGGDRAFGREIVKEHIMLCVIAGVEICGTNAEVMASQWEFQIGTCDPMKVCDDLVVARYLLCLITEKYGCWASFHPKPYKGNWNGSGCHTNFSTAEMRAPNGFRHILAACKKLNTTHAQHLLVYGEDNDQRLTGAHETSAIDEFTFGVGNRGCSVRIPLHVVHTNCGYLEDRRPGSNCDPYLVVNAIMNTVCGSIESA
jgi:glutamine synthetase